MPNEKSTSLGFRIGAVLGSALIFAGAVWSVLLLVTTTDTPTAVATGQRNVTLPTAVQSSVESRPLSLSLPLLYDGDLGTRSVEFSAVTLNESTNRLVVADDEGRLFEFDVTSDGEPVVPARRTIDIAVGDSDIEGVAWITDTTYVLAHEADGVLSVVDIADDVRLIGEQHRLRTLETGISARDGKGVEGVTVGQSEDVAFVVVVERPPSLRFIGDDGDPERVVPLDIGLSDVSDVWVAPDGTIWVVSHEDAVVVHLDVSSDGTITQRQQINLVFPTGRFPQAEGVVMSRDGGRLYVVGEGVAPNEFTFGFWSVEPG